MSDKSRVGHRNHCRSDPVRVQSTISCMEAVCECCVLASRRSRGFIDRMELIGNVWTSSECGAVKRLVWQSRIVKRLRLQQTLDDLQTRSAANPRIWRTEPSPA